MQNFNTNQTRHLYVAGAVDSNVDTNLDIAVGTVPGENKIFFKYRNNDGLLVRSDTIDKNKVVSVKYASVKGTTNYANMARPLIANQIVVDSSKLEAGKTYNLKITIHGVFDYDDNNTITTTASVVGTSANTATAAAFYKDLAKAIVAVLPKNDPSYPFFRVIMQKAVTASSVTTKTDTDVTSGSGYIDDATSIVLLEAPQKYVRGKLSGEPCTLSIASTMYGALPTSYDNTEMVSFLDEEKTVRAAASTILSSSDATKLYDHPLKQLCDLEYFALGERGDYYRGSTWPNNYDVNYALPLPNASNFSTDYCMASIQYYWSGDAENVQKSPRLIEIVAVKSVMDTLKSAINSALS